MDQGRIAKLTKMQRACLRLVARPMTSKEIARELGIASNTVDQHLKAAMATLGVNSRQQAARLLMEYESPPSPQSLVSQLQSLAGSEPDVLPALSSIDDMGRESPVGGEELRERRAPFDTDPPADRAKIKWPFSTDGRRGNDLRPIERMIWIFVIMILLIMSFAMLASTAETIGRIRSSIAADS